MNYHHRGKDEKHAATLAFVTLAVLSSFAYIATAFFARSAAEAPEPLLGEGGADDADTDYSRADARAPLSKEDAEFDAEMRRMVADSVDQQRRQGLLAVSD